MLYQKRLFELRDRPGITRKKVAEDLNICYADYCDYENEKLIMPIKHLNNVANYFNVSIDYILGLNNKPSYQNSNKEIDTYKIRLRLRELRKENNLNQEALAKFLGINKGTVAKYENQSIIIPTLFLKVLCEKYNFSSDYLLGKTNKPKYLKGKETK